MSNTNIINTFLDYDGLSYFWSIIVNKFANKSDAINDIGITGNSDNSIQSIIVTYADNNGSKTIPIPNASEDNAGLMSAEHFNIVNDFHHNITELIPLTGIQIKNDEYTEEVNIVNNKATLMLDYEKIDNRAYISLIDATYPSKGRWIEKSIEEYNSIKDSLINNQGLLIDSTGIQWLIYYDNLSQNKYFAWSEPNEYGPINDSGMPIMRKPISKIDVTEFISTSILASTDVISKNGKTMLKLGFKTVSDGDETVSYEYIDVTDLVDIYIGGEGIEIISRVSPPDIINKNNNEDEVSLDEEPTTTVLQLKYANDLSRGGIRTGYVSDNIRHYAVQLVQEEYNENNEITNSDSIGKAYVIVPWNEHNINIYSEDTNDDSEKYINITDESTEEDSNLDGSKLYNHLFKVEISDSLKSAEKLSKTAVQTIEGETNYITTDSTPLDNNGTKWAVSLDDSVKNSLTLADSAVQVVNIANVRKTNDLDIKCENENSKGEKEYIVTLGTDTINSLNIADTSVQIIIGDSTTKTETDVETDVEETINYINVDYETLDTGGIAYSISLDKSVKDSLKLADTAVQVVNITNVRKQNDLIIEENNESKDKKEYIVALGTDTINSLNNADTALQSINIFGRIIDIDNTAYAEDHLVEDLSLGNAIKCNISDSIAKDGSTDTSNAIYDNTIQVTNLPTVEAVRNYVESIKDNVQGDYYDYALELINSLDSTIEAPVIEAQNTAQNKDAQSIFTKVVIKNGKLISDINAVDDDYTIAKPLMVSDIVDFCPLKDNDFDNICNVYEL